MIRWAIFAVLMLALLASSIGVVTMRHESRQLFVQLARAQAERDQASVEWSQLQIEQAWLGDAPRIERQARDQLGMRLPARVGVLVDEP